MKFPALLFVLISFIVGSSPAYISAQKVKDLEGEYMYQQPDDESRNVAEKKAVQRAQINALAREFGTIVASRSTMTVTNEKMSHIQIGVNEVKGEWIKDNKAPEITPIIDPSTHKQYLKVKVWFKAREIISQAIDVETHLLRNGVDLKYEDHEFYAGDEMFLYFRAPVDGYLVVYQLGEDNNVYRLLPYSSSHSGAYEIKANEEYTLFYDNFDYCKKKGENPRQVDGIILTADKEIEWNSVCVIFSPNAFTHPQDFDKGKADGNKLGLGNRLLEMPRVLSSDKFQDWLAKSRINDKKMSYTPIDIQIRRK